MYKRQINIDVKDETIKDVLEIIKKHDYRLVYSTSVIDACKKKVTMNLKKATVAQVLDEAFKATDLVYKVDKNLIKMCIRDRLPTLGRCDRDDMY